MPQTQVTEKDLATKIIESMPADSTLDEVLRELAFGASIQRGLADLEAGRFVTHEQMKKDIASWLK